MSFENLIKRTIVPILSLALLVGIVLPVSADPGIQQIYSWKEKVIVYPSELEFKAKLDTGAKTSSVNAIDIEEFEHNGEDWVRFTLQNEDGDEEKLERRIERIVKIKEHNGDSQERFVVKMGICLGTVYKEVEVNLVDRSNYTTGMLVGRTFMENDVLIDPSSTFTHSPNCNRKSSDDDDDADEDEN